VKSFLFEECLIAKTELVAIVHNRSKLTKSVVEIEYFRRANLSKD
jgi:hypothetical protein